MGQEPRHQRDSFITCVLSLGQKGSALSSTPARVMRFRLAIVWGTGELSAEQGRGELREVGDGDLSREPGCVGEGGGGKTKEGGGRSEPRALAGALRSQDQLSECLGLGPPRALSLLVQDEMSLCTLFPRGGGEPPSQSCWQAILCRGRKAMLQVGDRSSCEN